MKHETLLKELQGYIHLNMEELEELKKMHQIAENEEQKDHIKGKIMFIRGKIEAYENITFDLEVTKHN